MPNGPSSKPRNTTKKPIRIERGSGNVFADLGFPNPDLALAKAKLVQQIRNLVAERNLTRAKAAEVLDLDPPKVAKLIRGQVASYTLDRLIRFLFALGQQVEISVRPQENNGRSRTLVVS